MFKLLLIVAAIATLSAGTPWKNNNVDNLYEEIQSLADVVSSSYFSKARCIGVITEGGGVYLRTPELPVFYITINWRNIKLDNLLLAPINEGCLAFIIQTNDMRFMVQTLSDLFRSPTSVYRENRKFMFLPPVDLSEEVSWKAAMNDVFSSTPMKWMPDLLIVNILTGKEVLNNIQFTKQVNNSSGRSVDRCKKVPSVRESYESSFLLEIYTHRFVGEKPSEMILLDTWFPGCGFLYGVNLFTDKLLNLMGKELKVIVIHYPPFSVIIKDTEPQAFDGIEFQALHEFGKRHNVTWRIEYDLENYWGEIWDNGSGTGIYGSTADDKYDFGYSAVFMLYREFFYFDYGAPFYQSGLTALAPKPKLLPGWLIPVLPFNSYLWCAVFISIVIVTLVFYVTSRVSHTLLGGGVASKYSTLAQCVFRTVGMLVLQVPEDERDYSTPRYAPLRHLVSWCILFFLVVTSAYCGGLAAILTLPRFQSPIETPKDLADSGLHWCAIAEAYIFSLQGSTDPVMMTIMDNFVIRSEAELIELAFDDNYALLVERLQGGYFLDMSYIFEEMMKSRRVMKENIINEHTVFVFRKGSPYKEHLNALVHKLRQSGLPIFWETITVLKFLSQRLQISIAESRAPPEAVPRELTSSHVQGGFYLLLLGLLLASITFLLELIRFRSRKKQKGQDGSFRGAKMEISF